MSRHLKEEDRVGEDFLTSIGGGRYETGVGFAIGVDRMILAKQLCKT